MKQVEMWKWFKLPVDCELTPTDCTGDSDSVSFSGAEMLTAHHVEKVEIAINSYDANQAIIAKQAEHIKMLREALMLATPYLPFNAAEEEKAYQALEATKEQA